MTLLAGIVGLLLSVAFAYMGNTLLFAQEFSQTLNPPEVDASILLHRFHLWVGIAVLLCAESDEQRFPGMEGFPHRIVNALGGRFTLNACR